MDRAATSLDTITRTVLAHLADRCESIAPPPQHPVVVVRGPGRCGIRQAAHLQDLLEQRGIAVTGAFAHECAALALGTTPIAAVVDLSPDEHDEAILVAAHRSVPLLVADTHGEVGADTHQEVSAAHMHFATPERHGHALSCITAVPDDMSNGLTICTDAHSIEGVQGAASVRVKGRHLEIDVRAPRAVHLRGAVVTISATGPLSLVIDRSAAVTSYGPLAVDCRLDSVVAELVGP